MNSSDYIAKKNPCMSRKIGERKFIVNQISSIFKFYEATFLDLEFDWIESHARSAKLMKSATNSGIVKVDSKATRYSDGLDIRMKVSEGPCTFTLLVVASAASYTPTISEAGLPKSYHLQGQPLTEYLIPQATAPKAGPPSIQRQPLTEYLIPQATAPSTKSHSKATTARDYPALIVQLFTLSGILCSDHSDRK
ncbi:hypothetical protein RhiirA4_548728 [Rhizophagus irregularis]|uniref:Uncharacterized protein n=1 Tax=Rhizophagus irregularis TaxID=588596 RepID=A0A2I1H985_9GLOM|nr:hypothetical protein RhiirA4_548728 [Rhizophagus irregularis]